MGLTPFGGLRHPAAQRRSDLSLTTGATIDGRALARNGAVTLDTNTITRSSCAGSSSPGGTDGGTGGGGDGTDGGAPGSTDGGSDGSTPAGSPRRRGTARLVSGPRTGPRQGAPRAGRCVSKPFTVQVTGRRIRQVSFFVDGRRVGTVRARSGRKVFAMRIDPRRQDAGVARVTARVTFNNASRTRPKNLRLTYQRCEPVQPRFTG